MSLIICLISGVFWSVFDLTRKISLKKIDSFSLIILIYISQLFFFFIWILNNKISINFENYFFPGLILILISVLSAFLFLESLKISEISKTIPLLSFTPIFSAILSNILLDEELKSFQFLGIFLITYGTMVLYSKSLKIIDIFYSLILLKKNKGANYMFIVAFIWSLTPILDKICLKYSTINIHGFLQALGVLFIILMLTKGKIFNKRKIILKNYKFLSFTVIIGFIATITQFFAISLTFVSIMESIKRGVGQTLSVFFGNFFFNEVISIQKLFGVALITFGVFIIIK